MGRICHVRTGDGRKCHDTPKDIVDIKTTSILAVKIQLCLVLHGKATRKSQDNTRNEMNNTWVFGRA